MHFEVFPSSPIRPDPFPTVVKKQEYNECITLNRYVSLEKKNFASGEKFSQLMTALQTASKKITMHLRKCGVAQIMASKGEKNKKLLNRKIERTFNDVIIKLLYSSGTVCIIACKDYDEIKIDRSERGKYIFCFTASDSQYTSDKSVCMGTIFSIATKRDTKKLDDRDILQSGKLLVASGYIMYGSSTMLVLATQNGIVNGFTLDHSIGEFILTDPNIKIPKYAKIYSANEGHSHSWERPLVQFLNKKKITKDGIPWSCRYMGTLVADFHRTLINGGFYIYPPSSENPHGKFYLLFECIPLAFIITQAEGVASNGKQPIINITPEQTYEKSAFYFGSPDNMTELLEVLH